VGTVNTDNAMNALSLELQPGSLVAGKYRVDRMLGAETMGEWAAGVIVAATHLHLNERVVLKVLRRDVGCDWEALVRFAREAKAAARLRSEHIACIVDAGVTEAGAPYVATEYLEGQSVARALLGRGPFDAASVAQHGVEACLGLAEAHPLGIVHRHIAPSNLFLVETSPGVNAVKILDFGIAKFIHSEARHAPAEAIAGSLCYMSPEQLRATAAIDHRTDIWSLGATLYELLTGLAPFDASRSLPELAASILGGTARPIAEVRADVPRALSDVVDKCLAKDRTARFGSARELALALRAFAPARARTGLAAPPRSMRAPPKTTARSSAPSGSSVMPSPMAVPMRAGVAGAPGGGLVGGRAPSGWVGWAGLAVVAGLVFFFILATAPDGADRLALGPNATAAPARGGPEPEATLAPPKAAPELFELVVQASPLSARVTVDGSRAASNPFRASYPRDGRAHHIAVQADGYEPKLQDVVLSNDTVVRIGLGPRRSTPGAEGQAKGASGSRP
jgi:eukaryotic-like serine/threonine-protein kinase